MDYENLIPSYFPSLHRHNHNNVNAKKLSDAYFNSAFVETEVLSAAARMDTLLDLLHSATARRNADEIAYAVKQLLIVRAYLLQNEYFNMGAVTDERVLSSR